MISSEVVPFAKTGGLGDVCGALPIAPLLGVVGIGLVSQLVIEMYFFGDRRRGVVTPREVKEWQLALDSHYFAPHFQFWISGMSSPYSAM